MKTTITSRRVLWLIAGFTFSLTSYLGCSHFSKYRAPSSTGYDSPLSAVPKHVLEMAEHDARVYGGAVQFTEGLTKEEALDLWHLTEGSDVFPLAWFVNMKSQFSAQPGTSLAEHLDQKFGVVKEGPEFRTISPFPFPWIGLSSAWSDEHPLRADVRLAPGKDVKSVLGFKELEGGRQSIAMVGVNCSFCHSNALTVDGRTRFIEGAPNMLNIRGFFQDLFASSAKTMLTPELLEAFLRESKVPGHTQSIADEFVASFKKDLGIDTLLQRGVGKVVNFLDGKYFQHKKSKTLREAMYERRNIVEDYLVRLLKLTYQLKEVSPELQLRMRFLAASIGVDPNLPVTPEGFARTDAFGRIANLVARTKNPLPLTATSSVPSMWNIEYRSMFHWNANTNSVVMRNIGQSFGLGALLTGSASFDPIAKYDSTSNLHNLHRLETLIYKVRAPRWREDFGGRVDMTMIQSGCETFHQTCAKCHMPEVQRVGPQKALIDYKMIPLEVIKTDSLYTKQQALPVEGQPFRKALFAFTGAVRDRYYQRFQVGPQEQAEWERRDLRGAEVFRDTVLGENSYSGANAYVNLRANPTPGYPARHLASVWATAPYLHNGSVPNLYELLQPAHLRSKMFFVGSRQYDGKKLGFRSDFDSVPEISDLEKKAQELMDARPGIIGRLKGLKVKSPANIWEAKIQVACLQFPERCFNVAHDGNSNLGHEGPAFGTDLPEQKKRELIEFMKVLRPEPEYSQISEPIYKWDGQRCQTF